MKLDLIHLSIAAAASASLLSLYFLFAREFLPVLLGPLDLASAAVFYTLGARVLVLLLIPKFRRMPSSVKIIVYSLEMVFIFCGVVAYTLTGAREDLAFIRTIFSIWIGSSFFILIPYFIYEFAMDLYKGAKLLNTLIYGTLLLADSLFAANFANTVQSLPHNLASLGLETIGYSTSPIGLASLEESSGWLVGGAKALFYVSLLVYVAISGVQVTMYSGKHTFALIIMIISNVALVSWILVFLPSVTNMLWILTLPGILMPALIWVAFRAKN